MMTTRPAATTLRDQLLPGDPISLHEAAGLIGRDPQTASATLTHLARQGDVVKARNRLWVRTGSPVDPYRLGARVASPYCFSYGSALALHGAATSLRSEVQISSPRRFDSFQFDGVLYRHVHPWMKEGCRKVSVGPEFVWATTAERTLVDCVRVPANAGGLAELLRAVPALPKLKPNELLRWIDHYAEKNLAARLGFLLETTDRGEDELAILPELERRRPSGRIYLERSRRGGRLVQRWNLIVPAHLLPQAREEP
jgi:predicted transcriptional regulator of viral defense system